MNPAVGSRIGTCDPIPDLRQEVVHMSILRSTQNMSVSMQVGLLKGNYDSSFATPQSGNINQAL